MNVVGDNFHSAKEICSDAAGDYNTILMINFELRKRKDKGVVLWKSEKSLEGQTVVKIGEGFLLTKDRAGYDGRVG